MLAHLGLCPWLLQRSPSSHWKHQRQVPVRALLGMLRAEAGTSPECPQAEQPQPEQGLLPWQLSPHTAWSRQNPMLDSGVVSRVLRQSCGHCWGYRAARKSREQSPGC